MQLGDHLNAEIVAGTVGSKQDAVDYLTWTFFFRRLIQNPSYYDLPSTENDQLSVFLSRMIETTLQSLEVRHFLVPKYCCISQIEADRPDL